MGRPRRPATIPPAEYADGGACGAEYDPPNGDAWAQAGYGIGVCRKPPGHRGRHAAGVAWGNGQRGDETVGEVTWE